MMQRLQKLLRIFLTAISFIFIGCAKMPEFPNWNPVAIIPSKGTKFTCRLIDKENMKFACDGEHLPLGAELDGYFCSSPGETKAVINWVVDAKQSWQKKCKSEF